MYALADSGRCAMLIGVCGKARSGKDTVASHLVMKHGFRQMSFAAPLKKICMEAFGLSFDQVHGDSKETVDHAWGVSPREILQKVGTEGFRAVHKDVWCRMLMREYGRYGGDVVVSDVRFPNEVSALTRAGGHVWKLERLGHHGASSGVEGHASELEIETLSDWHFDMILEAHSGDITSLTDGADYYLDVFRRAIRHAKT